MFFHRTSHIGRIHRIPRRAGNIEKLILEQADGFPDPPGQSMIYG